MESRSQPAVGIVNSVVMIVDSLVEVAVSDDCVVSMDDVSSFVIVVDSSMAVDCVGVTEVSSSSVVLNEEELHELSD